MILKAMQKLCIEKEESFGAYLCIDSHPMSKLPLQLRIRSNILGTPENTWFFLISPKTIM